MKYTSEEIANILNGTIEGDSSKIVSSIAKLKKGKMEIFVFCQTQNILNIYTLPKHQ